MLPEPIRVARNAMATRFEIALHGSNAVSLRAAGEEALDEVDRLESRLSLYRPETEIARVNAGAHLAPVRVTPEVFRLLDRARQLSVETGGAFDITIAPLVRCWGFMGGRAALPSPDEVAMARAVVGMSLVEFDRANYAIRFKVPGVMLDLGAIGKGYAIDRAADVLREAGVTSALIHGGTSSTFALGRPPGGERWKVAITSPTRDDAHPFAAVELEDESLSVSAVWGRSFESGEKSFGHIIDPRTGYPLEGRLLSAIVFPSATEGDALTTALLTDPSLGEQIGLARPSLRYAVLTGAPANPRVFSHRLP